MTHDDVTAGRPRPNEDALRHRLLLLDVDGVLTGGAYFDFEGASSPPCMTPRDCLLVPAAVARGFSGRRRDRRAAELGVHDVILGRVDMNAFDDSSAQPVEPQVAYVGDDVSLLVLKQVGCGDRARARPEVLQQVQFVTRSRAAWGVRDVIEVLLAAASGSIVASRSPGRIALFVGLLAGGLFALKFATGDGSLGNERQASRSERDQQAPGVRVDNEATRSPSSKAVFPRKREVDLMAVVCAGDAVHPPRGRSRPVGDGLQQLTDVRLELFDDDSTGTVTATRAFSTRSRRQRTTTDRRAKSDRPATPSSRASWRRLQAWLDLGDAKVNVGDDEISR